MKIEEGRVSPEDDDRGALGPRDADGVRIVLAGPQPLLNLEHGHCLDGLHRGDAGVQRYEITDKAHFLGARAHLC